MQIQLWTKNIDPTSDKEMLENLHKVGLFHLPSVNQDSNKFWSCFSSSLNANPKGINGKQRVLSIIVEKFNYKELNDKLKVHNSTDDLLTIYYETNNLFITRHHQI